MFETRHLIHSELGANPLYAGNGLTKPLDKVATIDIWSIGGVHLSKITPTDWGID